MPTSKRDYYEVLNVARNADGEEIKRSYRRLAMKYHPDRADGDKAEAEVRFKECSEAYEVLSDPDRRRRYDQFGHEGTSAAHDFSHMDVGDIFSMFQDIFGGTMGPGGRARGGGRAGQRQVTRGFDLETKIELTLEEIAAGAEKQIDYERHERCQTCSGSGARPGTMPVVCNQCGGQGRVAQQGFGGMFRMVTACPQCRGRGTVIREVCPNCRGSGRQMRPRSVVVKVPPGVHEGQAVRVQGEGEFGENGAPPGDLHVYIAVKEHPIFSRHGNDIVCQVPISFSEAALGATIEAPTLKGEEKLEIPAGSQHGAVFKMKGHGLPDLRSQRTGDEIVQIVIEVPKKMSEKQKQLLREFAATEDARVHAKRKGFLDKLRGLIAGEE